MPLTMTISNYPDFVLIEKAKRFDGFLADDYVTEYDKELDLRKPEEATFYFGDCAGKSIFLPVEEYDSNGNLIVSEVIGYDDESEEIWS